MMRKGTMKEFGDDSDSDGNEDVAKCYSMRSRISSSKLNLNLFPSQEEKWKFKIEPELSLFLLEEEDIKRLQNLYEAGLTSSKYLISLGRIIGSLKTQQRQYDGEYYENMQVFAYFLIKRNHERDLKLMALKTLMMCLSPPEASWQACDSVVAGTLDFLVDQIEWEYMDHTQSYMLEELKRICLAQIKREQERVAQVARTGEIVSILIASGAKVIESGIQYSEPAILNHVEKAGAKVKNAVQPEAHPLFMDRDAIVALCWSDAAKRASKSARDGTRKAVHTLKDVSNRGMEIVASRFEKDNLTMEKLSPEGEEAIRAIGKVGMASLGAAAVVGGALVETGRVIVKKTSDVTADIVHHKYGASAGQVVSDAGETADNLIRTVGNVAMLDKNAIATTTAKNVGRHHVDSEYSKGKDSLHLLEIQAAGMIHQALGIEGVEGKKAILNTKSSPSPDSEGLVRL